MLCGVLFLLRYILTYLPIRLKPRSTHPIGHLLSNRSVPPGINLYIHSKGRPPGHQMPVKLETSVVGASTMASSVGRYVIPLSAPPPFVTTDHHLAPSRAAETTFRWTGNEHLRVQRSQSGCCFRDVLDQSTVTRAPLRTSCQVIELLHANIPSSMNV